MIRAWAYAKVNLALRVVGRRHDGLHELEGLFHSIDWSDHLGVARSNEDEIVATGATPLPDGEQNLAWKAAVAVRTSAAIDASLRLELDKHVPVAAGLGGGSADAAAAMAATAQLLGVSIDDVRALAPGIGSDVPFCLSGGCAVVTGTGERVAPLEPLYGFVVGVVVPPVELATGAVYDVWDRLGGPSGTPAETGGLPPALRDLGPLANDLTRAAVFMAPRLDDWRFELERRWGRPVLMSGSGPSLMGFFIDDDEASAAIEDVPPGARAARAAAPVPFGWILDDGRSDPVDSKGRRLRAALERWRPV